MKNKKTDERGGGAAAPLKSNRFHGNEFSLWYVLIPPRHNRKNRVVFKIDEIIVSRSASHIRITSAIIFPVCSTNPASNPTRQERAHSLGLDHHLVDTKRKKNASSMSRKTMNPIDMLYVFYYRCTWKKRTDRLCDGINPYRAMERNGWLSFVGRTMIDHSDWVSISTPWVFSD